MAPASSSNSKNLLSNGDNVKVVVETERSPKLSIAAKILGNFNKGNYSLCDNLYPMILLVLGLIILFYLMIVCLKLCYYIRKSRQGHLFKAGSSKVQPPRKRVRRKVRPANDGNLEPQKAPFNDMNSAKSDVSENHKLLGSVSEPSINE
ncbi:unnamed protein product [Gordionus sp. m RMFG-2023]